MADRVGEQLGNYRLLQLIGRGGFADVYLGEHVRLGNQYAIKVLQTRLETEDIEAFQREARTIGRLAHPNIVRVYDFAVQDGAPFLAMDYAPNGTLRQRYAKGARLPLDAIRVYVRQVADALNYAHEQRVVHRDVKPENMLIGPLDDILLSDFGIAVVSQSSRYQTANEMVGTVGYMAPEQIQGHPRPASDQYALGIVVYEWLCGERPFKGSVTEVATQHLAIAPPPLRAKVPDLSPALEDVVLTALAKDPDQRFGSVRAFATALENAASAAPSIYSLATQLGGPTIAGSLPVPGDTLGNAETMLSSQPIGSQPPGGPQGFVSQSYGGAPTYGSAPAAPSGWVGSSPQPWAYGAPVAPQITPQITPLPPPPPGPPPGSYPPPVAPVATRPLKARRGPLLWAVVALIVLLVGGGSAAALIVLNAPHPKITVSSSYSGSAFGGPPDTVLHVIGQDFSSNSTITFLLDGAPAPGAQLAESDGNGAFSVHLKITDDWTFSKHTLTARDASGHVTQQGKDITVVPQPVLDVKSDYQDGSVLAGSTSTSFAVSGKRFAPNAQITFLLDGNALPGSQPIPADARGRVQTTLTVTNDWSIGNHTLTAQDNQGDSTQTPTTLEIVPQGQAGTPGPNGAPADDASFTIFITVQAKDVGTGAKKTFNITLNVSQGKVCNNSSDTGQPQNTTHTFSNGTSYEETYVLTCSGTYKAGRLSYTETDTRDTYQ
ncbi:MAG TPA: serine/threonine-protein kinase, partial [Ktedonobacterales bacterium]